MRRFILTGAPGAGKTSILRALQARGASVVDEAATDVIAAEQTGGDDQPWTSPSFIEKVLAVQRLRLLEPVGADRDVQIFDRSPVCTLALCKYLGYSAPAALTAEISRINREQLYERQVFFVRNIGFSESTAARRISFADSLRFEQVHEETYRACGYQLVEVPAGSVAWRAALVLDTISGLTARPGQEPWRSGTARAVGET